MRKLTNVFELEDVREDYPRLLRWLRDTGEQVSPRGAVTHEQLEVTTVLDPHYPLVTGINRGISTKLISLEALSLIGGVSYPQRTVTAVPEMARFLTGESFHGAYGVRIRMQLQAAVERLRADRDSRQALMTVWNPFQDLLGPVPKDVPCTALIQFFIRNGLLIQHTTMRSNDAWWGLPHDWGQFTQLQLTVARSLGVEAGPYIHHAVSFHLYERDFEKIDSLYAGHPAEPPTRLTGIGEIGWPIRRMQERACELVTSVRSNPLTTGEEWHIRQQKAIDVIVDARTRTDFE